MSNDAEVEFCAHCGCRLGEHKKVPWWHPHRRLYDWTLAWAYRPSSSVALFTLSFSESIIFPVPPDVLLMPLVLGNRRKWLRYAFLCSLASVLGAVAAYLIGWLAWAHIDMWMYKCFGWAGLTEENFTKIASQVAGKDYRLWVFGTVFTAGVTPLPFKVFNIFAGMFGTAEQTVNPVMFFVWFLIAATLSRSMRFFLLAVLMRLFGAKITPFIDKYFNWLALAFAVLLVGGFVVVKYML
ncbi:unnamed protein product [marine sediment metagenome]|uniref:DedA family protein n=1 Tax=marine sediment metagenome TaxID=412755 RepID=X0STC7_9ZZZZ